MRIKPALLLVPALLALAASSAVQSQPQPAAANAALVAKGKELVTEGDCAGCHTAEHGPMAGGLPLTTPMGTLVAANITPDNQTGIGAWTADDFYTALHTGQSKSVGHLYPAMPYNYYTKVTRADSDAMFAYLRTVPAVNYAPKRNQLPFPLNIRAVMGVWNLLFFRAGEFTANPAKSAEWNQGAYLVEGPGHCGACHTPMNLLGAPKTARYLQSGVLDDWTAPDLTANPRKGLGSWTRQDVIDYLKTGRNLHANAAGPMGDVVVKSTAMMSDADLGAIAAYLADQPASKPAPASTPATAVMTQGEAIYVDNCAGCHRAAGLGAPGLFPPLRGHAGLQQTNPTTVIRVILQGVQSTPTAAHPTGVAMPAFAWKLKDDQVAAVATYARNAWGNTAPVVTAVQAAKLRRKLAVAQTRPPVQKLDAMTHPGPSTLGVAGTDSRDNGTAKAGQPAS